MRLIHGDCLEEMQKLAEEGIVVDLVLCDPPYGTTACKWDSVVPFVPMWALLSKLVKHNGAIVLFGSEPFSSALRMSNIKEYKYDWVWVKSRTVGFLNAKNAPLKKNENIIVFSRGNAANNNKNRMEYYPQGLTEINKVKKSVNQGIDTVVGSRPSRQKEYVSKFKGYPSNILSYGNEIVQIHPTQKPVPLMEYLIKTYSNEGETVLDFAAGSFTTAIACINTNRKGVMIEKDPHYFKIGSERVERALSEKAIN